MGTANLTGLPGLSVRGGEKTLLVNTKVGMTFWPQDGIPISKYKNRSTEPIDVIWDAKKTKGALIRFTWSKHLGDPSGTWQATLKDRSPYRMDFERGDVLADDWCDVSFLRNGVAIPVCRGTIDNVQRVTQAAGGANVRVWELAGRDHGAFFAYPLAFHNIYVRTLGELVAGVFTERVRGKIGGSPAELFKIIIEAAFANGATSSIRLLPPKMAVSEGVDVTPSYDRLVQTIRSAFTGASVAPNGALLDILKITTKPTRGAYYNELALWNNPGTNLHQTLTGWCNPLFNEFIYDLAIDSNYPTTGEAKSKIEALIRERPFVTTDSSWSLSGDFPWVTYRTPLDSPWFGLTTWTLPSWLILDDSIGMSAAERINMVQLLADVGLTSENEQVAQAPPSWDRESIKRHGLRLPPIPFETRFVQDGNKGLGQWVIDRRNWQSMLVDWYCLNPWFWSGTITTKVALPEIRVGHRIKIDSGNASKVWTFYVEGVQHEWESGSGETPPGGSSTFTVTRGWQGTDNDLVTATREAAAAFRAVM